MADNLMTLRMIVREVATGTACTPRSCPSRSPACRAPACTPTCRCSRATTNAFCDPDDEYGLSGSPRAFIAGLLHHAAEITAVTNQLVNSYKRLVPGFEAPVHVSWARNNRSALVRVPVTKKGKEDAGHPARVPLARPGLQPVPGLLGDPRGRPRAASRGLRLPPEADVNLFETPRRSASLGIRLLPSNLSDALDQMEGSELVRDALGEHIFEWFLRNKRAEWEAYHTHVTSFELDRYLRTW